MALEPTGNSRIIGHYPTVDELRNVARSNGVDTSMGHATISDDYSRLLYPCKEKTEGKWPNCAFTLLVVQLGENEETAEDGGGDFTVYANGEHCHNGKEESGIGKKRDSLVPGATVEVITLDDDESSDEEDSEQAVTSTGETQRRAISKNARRKVSASYTFHSSVATYEDVNRVRMLDEQNTKCGLRIGKRRYRFRCRRGAKDTGQGTIFTGCPRRMLAVRETNGSYTIYTKGGEHNHPIDERPRRVFRIRQLAAQYLNDSGKDDFSPPEPPPHLLTDAWLRKHSLTDEHKFLGRMGEVECWALLGFRGTARNKTSRIMSQAKTYHACQHLSKTNCRYKLYTIPIEDSEGKEFYVYERGSHNDHVEKEAASSKDVSGVYLKSLSSWDETDKFRMAKRLKKMSGGWVTKDVRFLYNCYTNGCNYSIKAIEGTTPDGSTEIRLYELNEHQHKRRVGLDEPLPEGVKKARLDGCTALEVDSAEWRTAYRIDQQFRYVAAMSQSEWKAHQKAHRITRNGILSFGGMKGGYYCAVNPYSGCQYRMAAVRDELDDDKVHVLEKGEHSDHVTINAPRGQKAKKEIPIGAGYTYFCTLTTIDEVNALACELQTFPMRATFEGRKRPYTCKKYINCHYRIEFIQRVENGPWEAYEKSKHLHPI